jgi:hypothetical protein
MGFRATTAGLTVVLLIATAAGCEFNGDDMVRGSGDIVTEVREVSGFTEVRIEGSGDVIVDVGESESLTIEADDNLLELIATSVSGSRLVIEFDEPLRPSEAIVYRIGVIEFDKVTVAGSADVVAPNLACGTFSVSVAGSGSFDLGGTCDALDVSIAGSGDVDASELAVARADVSIAGSGDVLVNATDALDVSIAGSGEVEYLGEPAIEIDISGSGDVRKSP